MSKEIPLIRIADYMSFVAGAELCDRVADEIRARFSKLNTGRHLTRDEIDKMGIRALQEQAERYRKAQFALILKLANEVGNKPKTCPVSEQ